MTRSLPLPELARASIAGVSARVAAGDVTPLDLARACLDAIELQEPTVNAFATVDAERVLDEARALTKELARGGRPRSSLHGVPVAVKDLIDVAGYPTRAGSAVLADAPPAEADATVVARLRRAGALVIGTARTHEFALGILTPATRNPHDRARAVGGSSGGSAAATAAYECFGALGTDTGGSIRIPAALCGVAGLKPRTGQVPDDGIVPLSPVLDSCGPLARSAGDLALLWEVLTATDSTPSRDRGRRLRVGLVDGDRLGDVADDVLDAVADAARALGERADVELVEATPPPFDDWSPSRLVPLLVDALDVHRASGWYPSAREGYGADMLAGLRAAEPVTAQEVTRALRVVRRLSDALVACLDECDALLLPTTPIVAPRLDAVLDAAGAQKPEVARALTRLCAPVNWCPLAAVSIPCGPSADGLPVGLQLIARDERTALEVAMRCERRA
ncbi:amidase [Conexibacter arvalis]|uniref:Aspartyl-tRNA(Asn)/glutamyl-tRNA(Gln) amidotransferase subunit A n=1 Tax=Conexibacter arvalis TaxID=912552 RepID=A0A840I7G2_9ACTN|nr:amidase [Conexibacter arvalis]MBB4660452.1 aspartyl-tRNA(Asn)/glutamyl-tRNA(Gln) amidotransferase subunit A [Conexibacter arvalis]